jgi:hypothetical protein
MGERSLSTRAAGGEPSRPKSGAVSRPLPSTAGRDYACAHEKQGGSFRWSVGARAIHARRHGEPRGVSAADLFRGARSVSGRAAGLLSPLSAGRARDGDVRLRRRVLDGVCMQAQERARRGTRCHERRRRGSRGGRCRSRVAAKEDRGATAAAATATAAATEELEQGLGDGAMLLAGCGVRLSRALLLVSRLRP